MNNILISSLQPEGMNIVINYKLCLNKSYSLTKNEMIHSQSSVQGWLTWNTKLVVLTTWKTV